MKTNSGFPTPLAGRIALSGLLLVHIAAGFANISRDSAIGSTLRKATMPWEKLLGVHQNWPMFVVPPRNTKWLLIMGIHLDGSTSPLHLLDGEPAPDGVVWFYSRKGKLERNATATKREYLRTSMVRSACAADPTLAQVQFDRVSQPTPKAWSFRSTPRGEWATRSERLKQWNCKR